MEADEPIVLNHFEFSQKLLSGEYVLSTRGGRSRVWLIYSRIADRYGNEIKEFVFCRTCEKVLRYNSKSTSNLVKHKCYILQKKMVESMISKNKNVIENEIVNEIESENETTMLEVIENPHNNNLTKLITKWIIQDCRSYNLLENDDLKAVFQEVANLGSKFGSDIDVDKFLPSSKAVAKNVAEIYEQCFERVKEEIISIKENGFGLTSCIWTDSFIQKSYIVLTIHFLINGILTSRLLGLRAMERKNCTSQNIYENIETILKDFDCKLSSKSVIVTNADNDITKTFHINQTLPCISHLLNNALQKAVEEVPEVAELLRDCVKLVNYFKKSTLNATLSDSLTSYSPNRWNTIYKMLSSIENNWSEILHSKNDCPQIETININHLKAVIKTLQPFEEALETWEEENSSTLHLVLVYLHELKKSCDTNDSEFKDFDFIESLKENLRFYLDTIVSENITTLHKLALFLYPPTNKLLQFSDKEKKCIEDECVRLMKCFKSETKPIIKKEIETETITSSPVSKRRKLFSDFVEPETSSDPNVQIIQEIQFYKNTRVVNSADFDVFNWWEMQKNNFPLLYKLSCCVLSTPASSAASQRIFSAASHLLCEKTYESLSKETELEQIMFINSNADQYELGSNM